MTKITASDKKVRRYIKYESELDQTFIDKIGDAAYGEQLLSCIQCGTCSATCPISHYMDYTPRRIIAMVRAGFKEEVLNSNTIWLCASCYGCTVDCPREIKITDVMYALKREAILEGSNPRGFPIPILANKFFRQVRRHGRQNETRLLLTVYLLTNPLNLLKNARMAMRLYFKGRLSLFENGIKQKKSLRKLLKTLDRNQN